MLTLVDGDYRLTRLLWILIEQYMTLLVHLPCSCLFQVSIVMLYVEKCSCFWVWEFQHSVFEDLTEIKYEVFLFTQKFCCKFFTAGKSLFGQQSLVCDFCCRINTFRSAFFLSPRFFKKREDFYLFVEGKKPTKTKITVTRNKHFEREIMKPWPAGNTRNPLG